MMVITQKIKILPLLQKRRHPDMEHSHGGTFLEYNNSLQAELGYIPSMPLVSPQPALERLKSHCQSIHIANEVGLGLSNLASAKPLSSKQVLCCNYKRAIVWEYFMLPALDCHT